MVYLTGQGRQKESFHRDWFFALGDMEEKEGTGSGTAGMQAVTLPHDWSVEYPFDKNASTCGSGGYLPAGTGWYKKSFRISEAARGKRILLYFEGAYMDASVWVNGQKQGNHIYGYTPFEFDITEAVRWGEDNFVSVRIDNSRQPGSRWYSGSGITRNVWMKAVDSLHVDTFGTYITTPYIGENSAVVRIETTLAGAGGMQPEVCRQENKQQETAIPEAGQAVRDGETGQAGDAVQNRETGQTGQAVRDSGIRLTTQIYLGESVVAEVSSGLLPISGEKGRNTTDRALGASVEEMDSEAAEESGWKDSVGKDFCGRASGQGKVTVCQETCVERPLLWSTESPVLYRAVTHVYRAGVEVDTVRTTFGIREIEFHCDKGFLLNGRRVKINGVCLHHDGGCLGAAVPRKVWRYRLLKLKQMGCNAVRFSHNPPNEELLDLCDELGFLAMDEAFDEWRYLKAKELGSNTHESRGYSEWFNDHHEEDLTTMLLRDRCHPCIILWSIGNEVPDQTAEDGAQTARMLKGICNRLDSTRPVTQANDQIEA